MKSPDLKCGSQADGHTDHAFEQQMPKTAAASWILPLSKSSVNHGTTQNKNQIKIIYLCYSLQLKGLFEEK